MQIKMSLMDGWNYTSSLNMMKVWNGMKILAGFFLSRILKRPVMLGYPISLTIEPTTACNLKCPECPSGLRSFTRPTGKMDYALYKKIIDEQYQTLTYLILYFQGEPYLHPDFTRMIKYASIRNIYTATSTNAHFLNDENCLKTVESGLGRIIISLDGTDQPTYEKYRIGGEFEKVLDGTRNLVKWRKKVNSKKPFIILQFLVFKHNEHLVDKVKELGKSVGVDDVWIKTAQIYDFEEGSNLLPQNEQLSRYFAQDDGGYRIKNRLFNHCWKMWHSSVISWDGIVGPCCFDKDMNYRFGDISKEPFDKIWYNEAYYDFRKQILNQRGKTDICQNCTEGTRIWI